MVASDTLNPVGCLTVKPGVSFDRIAPAGFRILGALDRIARDLDFDLVITCGADAHEVNNPHTLGRAYDVRTHGLTAPQKLWILRAVMLDLADRDDDAPLQLPTVPQANLATRAFFAQLEYPGESREHLHIQSRRGVPM